MSFSNIPPFTILLLIIPPFLWGGNFVVGSVLATDMSGFWMNFLRWSIALMVLLPLCGPSAWRFRHVLVTHWRRILVLASLGVAGFNTLLYVALYYADVSIAAIAFACTPFLILGIVSVLDRRWPTKRLILAASVALSGMILAQWHALSTDVVPIGVALVLIAALTWAGYCVAIKRLPVPAPLRAVFLAQVLTGLALMAPIALWREPLNLAVLRPLDWLGLAYLGICAGALAFWLWNLAVPRAGSARASLFMNLVPVSSIVLAAVYLNDEMSAFEQVAICVVFLGILMSVDHPLKQIDRARHVPDP